MAISKTLRCAAAFALVALVGCSSSDAGNGSCSSDTLSNCGNYCADLQNDAANCGACGTACGAGQACVSGSCVAVSTCAATDCNGTCTVTASDPKNCGTCGTVCPSTAPYCNAGLCSMSCGTLRQCGNACADVNTDLNNCGSCGIACGTGQACVAGLCKATAIGTGGATGVGGATGNPTGGSTGTPTGGSTGTPTGGTTGTPTGGSTGTPTGGSTGTPTGGTTGTTGGTTGTTGGTTGTTGGTTGANTDVATALKCTDPMYGEVNIPAAAVISDFENGSMYQYAQDGRGVGADPWHSYANDDTNADGEMSVAGPSNPKNAANIYKVDTTQHGPCSTKGAMHVKATVQGKEGAYVGFGIDFMARTTAKPRKKNPYDASKYTGVGFWAKCAKDVQFAFMKVVDAVQDADIVTTATPTVCSYSATPKCNQYGVKNSVLTNGSYLADGKKAEWTYYKMYFSELLQDPTGSGFGTGVDPKKVTAFQIHVNPFSPRTGTPAENAIDCYIDDVHFLSEPMPPVPAAGFTEWTVTGNKLKRGTAEHKIHGLVRPSMEWDCSGFGVTREDVKRMKAWSPNAIRLAVMDSLWTKGKMAGSAGKNACATDPKSYQRSVKRVINWILAEGMDVILDLHYVAGAPSDVGMPTAENAAFWTTIAADPFFQDPRIIYEIYNEPNGDATQIATWMQSTVTAIRGAGATKNLILVAGTDWTFDLTKYQTTPVTGGAIAYAAHPYAWKTEETKFSTLAATAPVVATEFGNARVEGVSTVQPTDCNADTYSGYISKFDGTYDMSWTSWAWIVDEWGCGFPQLLKDYSGEPNVIGTPVRDALLKLP